MKKVILNSEPFQLGGTPPDDVQAYSSDPERWRMAMRSHVWRPPTDVYETDDFVVVRVEIAGMEEEDLSVSITGRSLVIRGLRQDGPERKAFRQMEIFFGEFVAEVELPVQVIVDEVRAEYKRGFLRVVLPKEKAHKVRVED